MRNRATSAVNVLSLWLAHETGHRLGSIRQLLWSDIDIGGRKVRWRSETDKESHEHETPSMHAAVGALRAERTRVKPIGDALIFPSPKDAQECISRYARAPLAVLCALGGWKDSTTVVTCYMRPDEATQRKALAKRKELRAADVS